MDRERRQFDAWERRDAIDRERRDAIKSGGGCLLAAIPLLLMILSILIIVHLF
jgi:hypothetical protein